jgi:hypothetical protein
VNALYDPQGLIEAQLPPKREPCMSLVHAMLAADTGALHPRDYQQIALFLTGHARAVAARVELHCATLPTTNTRRSHAEALLAETKTRLTVPPQTTLECAKNRARLVRALYEQLDQLAPTQRSPLTS